MISIIITYYKGLNILRSCLLLLQNMDLSNVEIIVVNDNPNSTLSKDMLSLKQDTPIIILTMPQNGGYAAACNYGVRNANGDFIVLMDSDILVADGWLEHLLKAYYNTEQCGAVSTTILNLNQKKVVHWGLAMNKGMEVIKPFRDGYLPKLLQYGCYEFHMASSGCILIPKKVYEEIGGFDEQFYNGFCDLDLTYRITKKGYKCLYCSDAIVYHRGKVSGTTRTASEDDTRALFMLKWKNELLDDAMTLLPQLYQANINFKSKKEYMLINFSRSLFAAEYHSVLMSSLKATGKTYHDFKNYSSDFITLEDFLPWSFCGVQFSIIYYCDNISIIINNQHWFMHRHGKGDIVADKNGNLMLTDELLM